MDAGDNAGSPTAPASRPRDTTESLSAEVNPDPELAAFPSIGGADLDPNSGIETDEKPDPGDESLGGDAAHGASEEVLIEPWFEDLEVADKSDGAVIQDPATPERYFWRDYITTLQREIWRPGDGDGERTADYYEKPGPVAPLETRWKLYQSRTGPGPVKFQKNEPPKYVVLDDRAAHEVLVSDIPRAHITKYWPHDFGGNGSIRARRPNRGRGAIGDFEADGKDRYNFATIANKKDGERYYFTGEPNYKPVIWNTNDLHLAIGIFKPVIKKLTSPPPKRELKWNQHGHNQFTPNEQLVKNGGKPRKGTSYLRYRDKEPIATKQVKNRPIKFPQKNDSGSTSPSTQERIESWRNGTQRSQGSEREDSLGREMSRGGSDRAKRRRLDTSAETRDGDDEDEEIVDPYTAQLEKFLVQAKEVTDEQQGHIDNLERQLSQAKTKIKKLENEVAMLRQNQMAGNV